MVTYSFIWKSLKMIWQIIKERERDGHTYFVGGQLWPGTLANARRCNLAIVTRSNRLLMAGQLRARSPTRTNRPIGSSWATEEHRTTNDCQPVVNFSILNRKITNWLRKLEASVLGNQRRRINDTNVRKGFNSAWNVECFISFLSKDLF